MFVVVWVVYVVILFAGVRLVGCEFVAVYGYYSLIVLVTPDSFVLRRVCLVALVLV